MWFVDWVNGHRFTFIGWWEGLTLVLYGLWRATHRSSEPFPGVVEYLNTHQEGRQGQGAELEPVATGPEVSQVLDQEVPDWMKT